MSDMAMSIEPNLLLNAAVAREPAARGKSHGQNEKTAKDFESLLLHKLLEGMERTIPKSGLLDGGSITGQVRSLFWHHMARELADKGGIGLWKEIQGQMERIAEPAKCTAAKPLEHLP